MVKTLKVFFCEALIRVFFLMEKVLEDMAMYH
jgi:hypothetical protein